MSDKKQSLPQKIFGFIHVGMYILLVTSPFYLKHTIRNKYGKYISYFLFATILSWVVLGNCPLAKIENSSKYGPVTTFISNIIGNIAFSYNKTIMMMSSVIMFTILFYYSPSRNYTIASIILLFSYLVHKYRKNKLNLYEIYKELTQ